MSDFDLPFRPIRGDLYTAPELFAGFDPADPGSFAGTTDFAVYRWFVTSGGASSDQGFSTMMQALHDNAVTQALRKFLLGRRCVAVMGGHKLRRDDPQYAQVVRLSRHMVRFGLCPASGGGPGAMEATHLGARLANADDRTVSDALATLAAAPAIPGSLKHLVGPDGRVSDQAVAEAHAWFAPAFQLAERLPAGGPSLAVPTWHYGHEPSSPLAGGIAKYFQNSIREDGLLAIATEGVVFTPGKAGTVQEVFQDACQNYYRSFGRFSPMVFLGRAFWTEHMPVRAVLAALLDPADFRDRVLFTDDEVEAAEFVARGGRGE